MLQNLEGVQAQIRNTSPRYAALTQPEPLSLDTIQQELDDQTIVLEYQLGEQQSYLWLITHQTVESYVLPPRAEIEAAIRDLRRGIQQHRELVTTVQTVSDMLLGPVAQRLQGQRLVIVPQGAVAYVPFATLINPQNPELVPLVVDHELVTLPSVSTLAVLREQTADREIAPKELAIVSDPVFNRTDPRLKAISPKSEDTSLSLYSAQITSAARSAGLNWQRLPYTQVEADAIASLISSEQKFQANGLNASFDTLTQQDLTDYQVLHFATHGLLNSEDPRLSALVLSFFSTEGQHQDGYLRLHEIYNLELAAELVVLSACETGIGKEVRGEGVMGLTRGFMYAGAERVVVSLWAVDDQGTAELMQQFYQHLWQQELTPAAALRAAQLDMWRSQGWDAPYYWAGFTLQGEWR
ncbi:MAG: CHAT domain-containing protein [Spirulina sp. SIO3F2]|nr:CHAT domain-containing protein [Spirulina sp. SIO3F2]